MLACPRCREKLVLVEDESGLRCVRCRLFYPVQDGIPQLLPESGRPDQPSAKGSAQSREPAEPGGR
ncbi:MAG: Trm112 family protein [Acidobacteriota bacterium]|nr:MAG: Trm112 family protein [Acidobacteriota bacterium]